MNTSNSSDPAALPSGRRLFYSTVIAAAAASLLLVAVVLPAEYGWDPLGSGRLLGLTDMGEIKVQLAAEAAADAEGGAATAGQAAINSQRLDKIEARLNEIYALLSAGESARQATAPIDDGVVPVSPAPATSAWRDEITITLTPGQGVEYKLVMTEGAQAEFEWTANGSTLNFDTHGNGAGNRVSYEKGRSVPADSGLLVAAFDGKHGWFFRNRTDTDVKLTLRTRGEYSELKRTA
ncbi:MAG: hypothetical protein ACR2QB_12020 [Gammaproteobacteria bacterium]